MAEQLDFGWVYELSPLETFRMLTRLEHLTEEARQLNHQQHSILELRERDGVFRYVAQRRLDVDSGSRARLFAGKPMLKHTQIWQPPNWDGSRRYETTAEINGMPVQISGGGGVDRIGTGGTRFSVNLTVESTGRLSARKLETGVAESLTRTIEAEHAFRLNWIDRRSHGSGF